MEDFIRIKARFKHVPSSSSTSNQAPVSLNHSQEEGDYMGSEGKYLVLLNNSKNTNGK